MFRSLVFFLALSLLNVSLAAETVIDWSLPSNLEPFEPISVYSGDSIRFEYPGDSINVLLYPSGTCDSTDWELIGESGAESVTYLFTDRQIDSTFTFATGYLNYCQLGMIINVTVLDPRSSEAPSDAPSFVPSSFAVPADPSVAPTSSAVPSAAPSQVQRADDAPVDLDVLFIGDETYDWSLPEDLQPFEQISVFARSTLTFEYPGETINLLRYPSGTCDDDTGAELIGAAGAGSASYTFDDSQIDTVVTFTTNFRNYCGFGMILKVLVLEPPPSAAPSLSPSASSSETPTGIPTLSPTQPLPTNPPTALSDASVVEEAVIDWSLPDNGQPYAPISIYSRGTIRFEYPGENINVLRYPSGTCDDSTGAELIGAGGQGNATYTFTDDQIDQIITFATDYWNFCSFGMIIKVLVLEPPPSAAPSEAPSGLPSVSPVTPSELPSIAPSPSAPVQPTMAPVAADEPTVDDTDTPAPTIAKKTRPPTGDPAGETPAATSAATYNKLQTSLFVVLASILALAAY